MKLDNGFLAVDDDGSFDEWELDNVNAMDLFGDESNRCNQLHLQTKIQAKFCHNTVFIAIKSQTF